MLGCILHDIGKPIYRTGKKENHSYLGNEFAKKKELPDDICDCIAYHHFKPLNDSNIPDDSPAYIAYIADNISSASDRRNNNESTDGSKFNKYSPLESVFNIIGKRSDMKYSYDISLSKDKVNIPSSSEKKYSKKDYEKIVNILDNVLDKFEISYDYLNYLDCVLKDIFSYIPSSTDVSQIPDISLYAHSKTTAAIGICISEYLNFNGVADYKKELFESSNKFYKKNAFVLFGAELKGINEYAGLVSSESALKTMRGRVFVSEMLFQNYIDEILKISGINSRINVLYNGGDRCYILIPNIKCVREKILDFTKQYNEYLFESFSVNLYMSHSIIACNANDLMGKANVQDSYSAVINKVNLFLEYNLKNKYSAEFLNKINDKSENRSEFGYQYSVPVLWSSNLTNLDSYAVINDSSDKEALEVICSDGAKRYMHIKKDVDLKEKSYRIYQLSDKVPDEFSFIPVPALFYSFSDDINALSDSSFRKISILKINADNIIKCTESFPPKYNTVSRAAVLSETLSRFFKQDINLILSQKNYRVTVIYSHNDEVLIIGNFSDIISSAIDIRNAFEKYTCNKLTISAGINLFDYKYPLSKAYTDVDLRLTDAKIAGKNSISLFEADSVFKWNVFVNSILNEKMTVISNALKKDDEYMTSFIHNVLKLFRNSGNKLNISRYAYLLAKVEITSESFDTFSEMSYEWIFNEDDRKEFIFALYIFLYSKDILKGDDKNGL